MIGYYTINNHNESNSKILHDGNPKGIEWMYWFFFSLHLEILVHVPSRMKQGFWRVNLQIIDVAINIHITIEEQCTCISRTSLGILWLCCENSSKLFKIKSILIPVFIYRYSPQTMIVIMMLILNHMLIIDWQDPNWRHIYYIHFKSHLYNMLIDSKYMSFHVHCDRGR